MMNLRAEFLEDQGVVCHRTGGRRRRGLLEKVRTRVSSKRVKLSIEVREETETVGSTVHPVLNLGVN